MSFLYFVVARTLTEGFRFLSFWYTSPMKQGTGLGAQCGFTFSEYSAFQIKLQTNATSREKSQS